jgi:hypothetical protein
MRKFKVLALALLIGTVGLFAANTSDPDDPKKEIRNQIVKLLEDPSFVIEKEMNVVIKFTFNSEGEIVVLCAGCKDKQVVNYIRKNLNGKKFDSPGVKDKIYKMPLKIKVA